MSYYPYTPYYPAPGFAPQQQPPPTPMQPQQNPQIPQLEQRLKDMELRWANMYSQPYAQPQQASPQQQQPSQAQTFVQVKSEEEAWNSPNDWQIMAGERRYFINEAAGEFYVKYFDANNAEMVRDVYRKIKRDAPTATESAEKPDPMISWMDGVSSKLEAVEAQIERLSELMKPGRIVKAPAKEAAE